MTRGIVFVVYGKGAHNAQRRALTALAEACPDLSITTHTQRADGLDNMQQSRFAKVTLLDWTPYEMTAYMDADTQVYSAEFQRGFDMLADGWDMAIVPSANQGSGLLWHIGDDDKRHTLRTLLHDPLQLQAGVFFVAKNDRTRALFETWRAEWDVFRGQDQGAFLRALHRCPVKLWLLGRPWNGGVVVGHHFGACRV